MKPDSKIRRAGGRIAWLGICFLTIALAGPPAVLAAKGGIPGKPIHPSVTEEAETAGNNLSFPVIWSDGVTKALRGDDYPKSGVIIDPVPGIFVGATLEVDGIDYYLQQDPGNEWRAETRDAIGDGLGEINVDRIDWGDNLEAKAWSETSVVRVETLLYQDLFAPGMVAYTMKYLYGEGPDEMWGTDETIYLSEEATVYSGCARLTIQKLSINREELGEGDLDWNSDAGEWDGAVGATVFNGAVFEAVDGPGDYSAEINIAGKAIYGYNWFVRRLANAAGVEPDGDYRITFSLDGENCPAGLNTYFDIDTQIVQREEGEEVTTLTEDDGGEPDLQGGTAVVDSGNNLTYIDVRILPKVKGGGSGGKTR